MPHSVLAWWRPGDWDVSSSIWYDSSGNGNDATMAGSGVSSSLLSGHGAYAPVTALTGTTATTINWGAVLKPTFTLCTVSRYTSASSSERQRIIETSSGNWFHGHHQNRAGVAYYDIWSTQAINRVTPVTNWLAMCGTNGGVGSFNGKVANGVEVGTSTGGTVSSGSSMVTNAGSWNEPSAFAIAEVIVWQRALSSEEFSRVYDHQLHNVLGQTHPSPPPPAPPALPPLPPPPSRHTTRNVS